MAQLGEVVGFKLLGIPKGCDCGGESQVSRVETATSSPKHNGIGYARYCDSCKTQTPLDRDTLDWAKIVYAQSTKVCLSPA